jgi:multiple sugar transport system permease protein
VVRLTREPETSEAASSGESADVRSPERRRAGGVVEAAGPLRGGPAVGGAVAAWWARRGRPRATALLYLLPALLGFVVFVYYPIVKGVLASFQDIDLVREPRWIGWQNFETVLSDPLFAKAWANTLIFTVLGVALGYVAPVVVSLVVNEMRRGRWFFQLAVYLPVMMPPIVTALLWRFIFDPTGVGVLNAFIGVFGIGPQPWLQSSSHALLSLVLISTWATFGFWVLVYLAALRGIPGELYDAAELDGAGILGRVRYITLPYIRHILLAGILLGIIGEMQIFTAPFVLTGGGPNNATVTVVLLIYQYAFKHNDFGSAAALGLLLMVFLGGLSGLYAVFTRRFSRV